MNAGRQNIDIVCREGISVFVATTIYIWTLWDQTHQYITKYGYYFAQHKLRWNGEVLIISWYVSVSLSSIYWFLNMAFWCWSSACTSFYRAAVARGSQSVDWADPESWIGTWSLDTVWSLITYSSFASLSGDSIYRPFHKKYNASTFHQRKYEKEPANRKRTEGEY